MNTNWKLYIKDVPDNTEVLIHMLNCGLLPKNTPEYSDGMQFYKIPLSELGLPSADHMLSETNKIAELHPPIGWNKGKGRSERYMGISLTYNRDYVGDESDHHQTVGGSKMGHRFSRLVNGVGGYPNGKNTYYDSFGFRHVHKDMVGLGIYDKFVGANSRGRIAYVYDKGTPVENSHGWHIDELPYHLMRINVPLQTSDEHVLELDNGEQHHLEVGYAYMWNTRIPHRTAINRLVESDSPRIHLVIGILPWLEYLEDEDAYIPSKNYGVPIKKIIEDRLFVKK